mgnify:CR=1 FL=1
MKKIIATVLAMVMALALCTVAFADVAATGYDVKNAADNSDITGATATAITTTAASVTTKDGKVTNGVMAFNTIGTVDYVVTTDVTKADYIIYKDGKVDSYGIKMANKGAYTCEATEFTAFGTACGTIAKVNKDAKFYTIADDEHYYVAGTEKYAKVGNAVVGLKVATVTTDYTENSHDYKFDYTTAANGDKTVTKVTCSKNASESFEFKTSAAAATAAFGKGNFTPVTVDGLTVYVKTGSGATNTTTNTTKPSPKTFDAGIAMYVGMALTSVAGSAVVIGKKKEF